MKAELIVGKDMMPVKWYVVITVSITSCVVLAYLAFADYIDASGPAIPTALKLKPDIHVLSFIVIVGILIGLIGARVFSSLVSRAVWDRGMARAETRKKVRVLIRCLKDGDALARSKAALALGKLSNAAKDAIPALSELAHDVDEKAREASVEALNRIRIS